MLTTTHHHSDDSDRDTQIDSDSFEESILGAWESIFPNRFWAWENRFQKSILTSILAIL